MLLMMVVVDVVGDQVCVVSIHGRAPLDNGAEQARGVCDGPVAVVAAVLAPTPVGPALLVEACTRAVVLAEAVELARGLARALVAAELARVLAPLAWRHAREVDVLARTRERRRCVLGGAWRWRGGAWRWRDGDQSRRGVDVHDDMRLGCYVGHALVRWVQ